MLPYENGSMDVVAGYLFLFVEMQMAASVACGNGLGDVQGQSHLVCNTAVAVHGHVTEQFQLLAL